MTRLAGSTHGLVALALIVAYVVLTVTGHDADALFVLLAGYLGGAASQTAVAKKESASG